MIAGFMVFLSVFAIGERDFFNTATEQQKQGYTWERLEECRAPDQTLESLVMETGTGKKLVCFKLVK